MADHYDYLFKIILLGDSGVGKTSIILRFSDNSFNPDFHSTIGVDFRVSQQNINNKSVKLQLWDTAGQERFRNIVSSYYRVAHAALFIFDITSHESFENIRMWIGESENFFKDSVTKFLVGNKSDLEHKRAVTTEKAQSYAEIMGMKYIEVSAKTAEHVNEAFHSITCMLIEKNTVTAGAETTKRVTTKQESSCCWN